MAKAKDFNFMIKARGKQGLSYCPQEHVKTIAKVKD